MKMMIKKIMVPLLVLLLTINSFVLIESNAMGIHDSNFTYETIQKKVTLAGMNKVFERKFIMK